MNSLLEARGEGNNLYVNIKALSVFGMRFQQCYPLFARLGYLYNYQTKELYNLNYPREGRGVPGSFQGEMRVCLSLCDLKKVDKILC
jgi:hypothetical protein